MTEGSRVLVALRVPAAPERAFAAFTDEIGTWWQPNGLFQFRDDQTGTLAFDPGPEGRLVETYADGSTFTVGDVLAWEPPHRLVLTWRTARFEPDQSTELHVTFTDVGPGGSGSGGAPETRVVVEHYGWDRIPAEHAARHGFPLATFQQRWAEWWQLQLARVSAAVDRG